MHHRLLRPALALLLPVAVVASLLQPIHASAGTAFPAGSHQWTENGAQFGNTPSGFATSAVAVGDLDGNGLKETVATYMDGKVAVFDNQGGLRWSRQTGGAIHASAALADVYGNGNLEVVVAGGDGYVYMFLPDGRTATGWPQHDQFTGLYGTPPGFFSSAVVGDLWGDGNYEVVAGGLDHHLYAWYSDGTPMAGFPIDLYDTIWDTPSLAPLEHDGHLDIVIGSDSSGPPTEPYAAGGVYWAFKPVGCGHLPGYSVGGTPQANCLAPGWPRVTDQVAWASTAIGDINHNGQADVVSASGTYFNSLTCVRGCYVNAFDQTGGNVPGWPRGTGSQMFGSPAVGDVTGNANNPLQVFDTGLDGRLYGWGNGISGFPVDLQGGQLYSSPAVAPIDNSGRNGVWACAGGNLQAVNGAGQITISYQLSGLCTATPTIADVGTGTLNVIVTAQNGANSWKTYTFPIPGAAGLPANAYPTFKGSMSRTGPAFVPASAGAIVRTPLSHESVVVRGDQNTIWYVPDGGGAFTYSSLDGQVTGAPAVVAYPTPGGGHTFLYVVIGLDHRLWEHVGWGGWKLVTDAGHYCVDSPAATISNGQFVVGCVGRDGGLYYTSGPADPTVLPTTGGFGALGGRTFTGPAAANVGGVTEFMVLGADSRVWYVVPGQPWVPTSYWCSGHPALGTTGAMSYFACHGNDGQLWISRTTSPSWGGAWPAGGALLDGPSLAVAPDGSAHVFVEGLRGTVWEMTTDSNGSPSGWTHRSGVIHGIGATGY